MGVDIKYINESHGPRRKCPHVFVLNHGGFDRSNCYSGMCVPGWMIVLSFFVCVSLFFSTVSVLCSVLFFVFYVCIFVIKNLLHDVLLLEVVNMKYSYGE